MKHQLIVSLSNRNVQLAPQHINPAASALIKRMLHADPAQRPSIAELQTDEFITSGYIPLRLPTTCLTVPPRFSMGPTAAMELNQRRPLTAINNKGNAPKLVKETLTLEMIEMLPGGAGNASTW